MCAVTRYGKRGAAICRLPAFSFLPQRGQIRTPTTGDTDQDGAAIRIQPGDPPMNAFRKRAERADIG
jgi:hypothetical protein